MKGFKLPHFGNSSDSKSENVASDVVALDQEVTDVSDASISVTPTKQPTFYVYCVVPSTAPKDYGNIGVEGNASVYTIAYRDIAAVVSQFPSDHFEKNGVNTLAHQRVVQKVFEKELGVPVEFGTIASSSGDVTALLEQNYEKYKEQLAKLSPSGPNGTYESSDPTDVIAEILAQSASSAVRIRQLSNDLDSAKRIEYEKGADRMAEGTAKQLLEFLAKAPPGTFQVSETPSSGSSERMQRLEQRLDGLTDQISSLVNKTAETSSGDYIERMQRIEQSLTDLRDQISYQVKKTSEQEINDVQALRRNQEKIDEAIEKMAELSEKNLAIVEKTVMGTLRDYFDHVPPAMEAFVLKSINGASRSRSSQIKSAPTPSPTNQLLATPLTVCAWCSVGIQKDARFCDKCGEPNTYREGAVS